MGVEGKQVPVPDFKEKLELTDEAFDAWVDRLDPSDREEFYYIYGGDTILLRFVCALDYLTLQKIQFERPTDMFQTAYWVAASRYQPDLDPQNPAVERRAIRAWRSDSVQALYDRVRYRSVRQGSIRLQNKLFTLAEYIADHAMGPEATFTERNTAAGTLLRIASLVDQQEQAIRAERTKRGLSAARDAMSRVGADISNRELEVIIKAAREQLGEEKLKALVAGPPNS